MLGVGSVSYSETSSYAEYSIRNIEHLKEKILPIFDKYILLTSKQFQYEMFRNSVIVYTDNAINKEEKEKLLIFNKSQKVPMNYVSVVWKNVDEKFLTVEQVQSIISKNWVVGFTEAKGKFYLEKKEPFRMNHYFEISQEKEKIVLKAFSLLLDMEIMNKNTYFVCVTTTQASVHKVIDYFFGTMKGMKSLEYRI
jgi:hypothetical protein